MIRSTITIHDVDHVSLEDTKGLACEDGKGQTKIVQVRRLTIRSGDAEFKIVLLADNPRLLDVVEEG